ncbi:restriction endonuclease subunit S [Limosilactobacillus vaginalis]|uniref:restriction endonuclease subunit S n=1 Tax=Limosilactobacillus vaginalis TaxID=1633 RepID=UPI001F08AA20|nr:restriction endonuclease subunit S [Limosilactobacillus vaginalis]
MKKTWEQRKLGKLVAVKSGKDYKTLNKGDIPVFGTGGYITSVNKSLSDVNAIGLGRKGTINKPYILKAPFWTVDTLFFLVPTQQVRLNFVYSLIQNVNWLKYDESTGLPSLSKKNIQNILVFSTNYEEQNNIGNLLNLLEKLLSLQQRKLRQLKQLKKAMLQQLLVSKKDRLTPNVRFSDFSGSWKKCKLGEVIQDYTEKTIVENQYPILTSSQQHGIILQNEYFSGSRVSKTGNIGYFILPRGYFAYRNRSDNDTYVFNRNDCIDRGIISRFYPVFKPYNADSNFLLIRLNNGLRKELSLASEGTGQHVLSLKNFKNIQTQFPNLEEQHKIGDFISTLNSLIALHQRKANILSNLKKFLLQKLFI